MDNSSTNHNQNADQQRNEDEKKLENYCRQACCLLDEIGATNFLYQIRRIKDYATEIFKDFRYDIEKSYSMINDNDPGDDGDKSKIKTSGDEYDPGEMITDTGEVIDELTPDGDNDDKNNDGGRTDDKNVDNVEYDFLKDLQENFEKNLKITKSNTIINDKMPFAILLMLHRMAKTLKEGIEKRKFINPQKNNNHFINIFSSNFFVPKQVLQEKDLNIDTLPKNILNVQMKIMLFEDQYNQQIIDLKSKINEKLMKKFRFIRSFFQIFRKELLLFLDFLTTIRSKTFPQPGPFYERHLLFKYWRGEYLGKNFRQYQSFTRMFINRMHTFLYLIEEELIDGHHTKNLEQAVRLFISNDDYDYSVSDDLLYQIPIIDEIFHYANTLLKFESDRANLILNDDNYFNNYGINDDDNNHDTINNNYPFLFSDLTITTDNLAKCGFSFFDPKSDNDDDVSTSVANPKNDDNNVQSSFADPKIATNAADICREYIFSDSENDDAPLSFSDLKHDSLFSFTNFKNVKK